MQIPECGSITSCPKCQALDAIITTSFHPIPQPPLGPKTDPCTELVMLTSSEELEEFCEHLCRVCKRCGFGWVEQVAIEGSVYEPVEEESG